MADTVRRLLLSLAVAMLAYSWGGAAAGAAEVYIPELKAKNSQKFVVPVMIDEIGKLAGVKLVITYDVRVLQFIGGEKTNHTNSLMHIVNDKNPGRLVIVMAGARGITGRDITLMNLTFQVKKDVRENQTRVEFKEVQLMTEQLTEVKATAKRGNITIIP